MEGHSEFITPERSAVYDKISDISHKLQELYEGLGADEFTLAAEHSETWARMPDSLWDLANDLRALAKETYRVAVECDDATKDIQPKMCTYEKHKENRRWMDEMWKELCSMPLTGEEHDNESNVHE